MVDVNSINESPAVYFYNCFQMVTKDETFGIYYVPVKWFRLLETNSSYFIGFENTIFQNETVELRYRPIVRQKTTIKIIDPVTVVNCQSSTKPHELLRQLKEVIQENELGLDILGLHVDQFHLKSMQLDTQ